MATNPKPTAKEFIGRTKLRKNFWEQLLKIGKGSTFISFYGAGGVGKSTLLKRLEDEIRNLNKRTTDKCIYVEYDFGKDGASTDKRVILTALKKQLSSFGCDEFQLFDWGNYYYLRKIGQKVDPPEPKSLIDKYPRLKKPYETIKKFTTVTAKSNTVYRAVSGLLSLVTALPGLPLPIRLIFLLPLIMSSASNINELRIWIQEFFNDLDDEHKEILNRLEALSKEDSNALYEFLPTLFALDVKDWMKEIGNKLVIILDNYETLIDATTLVTTETHKADLWIHGNDGLFYMLPNNTLWIIAGRNKLHWTGTAADKMEQYKLRALSRRDTARYLKRSGVTDKNLRNDLFNLTKGYPYYLDLCVDLYFKYKHQHNDATPPIEEFGEKREEVVERIFRYLNKKSDDVAKDLLEFLSVLNVWTDELAEDIGRRVLNNFSRNTYRRVKGFSSLVETKRIKDENLNLMTFRFEKKVQGLIFAECNRKFIAKVKAAGDEYFKKFFEDKGKNIYDAESIFYLKLWAGFIVRLDNDAESLRKQFAEKLSKHINSLTNRANFEAVEEILALFVGKLKTLNAVDSAPCAYFEKRLSTLRIKQGRYNEALAFAESAYDKRNRYLGEKNSATLSAMHTLANAWNKLNRPDEALLLQEKVLTLRREISGDEAQKTLDAINNLTNTYDRCGRYEEALNLQNELLAVYERKNPGAQNLKTLSVMNDKAITLRAMRRYEEALELRKQVFDARKELYGEEYSDTIDAMENLAISLGDTSRYEDHIEALKLKVRVLALRKKNFKNKHHPDILRAMNNLANTLIELSRHDKALIWQKKVLAVREKNFASTDTEILAAMENLAATLKVLGGHCRNEELKLREKILELYRINRGNKHRLTRSAMKDLADLLKDLGRNDEESKLREELEALNTEDAQNSEGEQDDSEQIKRDESLAQENFSDQP